MTRSLTLAVILGGCTFHAPTPIAYVKHGPAYGQLVTPLAALPVTCGAKTMGCLPGYKLAVANATRMAIELGGYSLVDSDLINAELQRRVTRSTETDASAETVTELTGTTWADLGAQQQRGLLTAMGIHGVLRATISMTIPEGAAGLRTITVAVAVTKLADDADVWQAECHVQTGDYHSEAQAIELATRCALESGTLW